LNELKEAIKSLDVNGISEFGRLIGVIGSVTLSDWVLRRKLADRGLVKYVDSALGLRIRYWWDWSGFKLLAAAENRCYKG
jgi:hypothetical protein